MFGIGDRVRLSRTCGDYSGATGTIVGAWLGSRGWRFKPDPEFQHIDFGAKTWEFFVNDYELIDSPTPVPAYMELFE